MESSSPVRTKLFIMMVLELAIWGAWLPLIFKYLPGLGFTAPQQSLILNAFPVAALIGLFFSNQFADRNFAAEKFLAFSHLVGGLAMLGLFWAKTFWPFFILMSVHCLLYVPTLSVTNSIAFANLKEPDKEFGIVRMGGTIGWILVAWPFTFILVNWAAVPSMQSVGFVKWLGTALGSDLSGEPLMNGISYTYLVSAIVSFALAAFSLTLPHTPPRQTRDPEEKLAWLEALRLLRHPFVLVLWIVAFIDSFVHNAFFSWAGIFFTSNQVGIKNNWVMPVMSLGQVAEILTMFILGSVLRRLGWRWTMIVGLFGYVARFIVFAYLPEHTWLIVAVNALHGICYAFFFATVYIFVDAYFPKDARASAQGLFNVMILGLGALAAFCICPWLIEKFTHNGGVDFRHLFLVPAAADALGMLLIALLFHPPKVAAPVEVGH